MGILTGRKSTALGNPHLCKSCTWGQFMTGYRNVERLAVCTNTSPNRVIPFAMLECSAYSDKSRPDRNPAKRQPIDGERGRTTLRAAGFTATGPLSDALSDMVIDPARPPRTM